MNVIIQDSRSVSMLHITELYQTSIGRVVKMTFASGYAVISSSGN